MNRPTTRSEELLTRAQQIVPGGVNSPVRAFRAVGGTPRFMASGQGAWLTDVDGSRYVDLVCSWGPMILGHATHVLDAVRQAAARGFSFGTPSPGEVLLAEEIIARVEPVEQIRLVSSGTEATMSAIRLARGFTGRTLVVKFAGCYHGHVDSLLAAAGSGVATLALPDSAGVPAQAAAETIVLPFNDIAALETAFAERGEQIAAVITEAAAGNMGVVPPAPGFTAALRTLTSRHGALLISDEVMTGFRCSRSGWFGLEGPTTDGAPDVHLRQGHGRWVPAAAFRWPAPIMAMLPRRPVIRPTSPGTRRRQPPDWPRCRPAPMRCMRTSPRSRASSRCGLGRVVRGRGGAPGPVGRVDVLDLLPGERGSQL